MSRVGAVVLCAGSSTRFGSDKLAATLFGKPVWRWSLDAFLNHPEVAEVVVVGERPPGEGYRVVPGGASRLASARAGIEALDTDLVLIHDGARPLVSADLISRVIAAAERTGASVPYLPITDTIKQRVGDRLETLDREALISVQTPQAGRRDEFLRAHAAATDAATDDVSLLEVLGVHIEPVLADRSNIKLTTESDLARAYELLGIPETRTGLGYDVHAFSPDPSRPLWLGGVLFEGALGLDGHSDADALLHAITDAVLGAAALGDIGMLFPNTDARFKDMRSRIFLEEAIRRARAESWELVHLDATVLAEAPKLMPRAVEIRQTIADMAGLRLDQVSLKATTHEKLGAIGRGEGISAMAVATLRRWIPKEVKPQ